MADESLSAVTALLDDKTFKRDMALVSIRFPAWSQYEVVMFTLTIHNHVALNMWAPDDDDPKTGDSGETRADGWKDPDDDDEIWKKPG